MNIIVYEKRKGQWPCAVHIGGLYLNMRNGKSKQSQLHCLTIIIIILNDPVRERKQIKINIIWWQTKLSWMSNRITKLHFVTRPPIISFAAQGFLFFFANIIMRQSSSLFSKEFLILAWFYRSFSVRWAAHAKYYGYRMRHSVFCYCYIYYYIRLILNKKGKNCSESS